MTDILNGLSTAWSWFTELGVGAFLKDWQDLTAGLLALFGAYLALRGIRSQIAQADRFANDRRAREEQAAMAALPLALSALSQYSRDCIRHLLLLIPSKGPYPTLSIDFDAPRVPDNVTGPLHLCARFAEPENVEKIQRALAKLQVQNSRLLAWLAKHRDKEIGHSARRGGLQCLEDAADLHAAVDVLIRYARNESLLREHASLQELTSAFHNSGLWDDRHPIWDHIDRSGPSGEQTGDEHAGMR